MKDDESAEHIVRSSILKLLRDESGSPDSSSLRVVEASVESTLNDIWAFRSKASGSPPRFDA